LCGQDREASSISQFAGGSALNVAVNLGELMKSRADAQCSFYGLVGDDEFGAFLRRRLAEAEVRDQMGTAAGKSTGCCIVLSGSDDRGFVTSTGATGFLSTANLESLLSAENAGAARRCHVHISGYFSCPSLQAGLPMLLRKLRERAAANGQEFSISIDTNCDATGQWGSGVVDVLREADVFLPNEVEALAIAKAMGNLGEAPELQATGLLSMAALEVMASEAMERNAGLNAGHGTQAQSSGNGQLADGTQADASAELNMAADRLASIVRNAVVITCGKDGCILQTRKARLAGHRPQRCGAPRGIDPVDATGAGDAFDAGFIFSWVVLGGTLEEAVRSGSCCGALCTESIGANSNPPSAQTLSQMEALHKSALAQIP
jgi:ribokinase